MGSIDVYLRKEAMGLPNPLWGPLRNIIVYNRRKIYIDNVVFRIHYTWTVMVLVAFSILVTSKLYIGDPINCMSSPDIKSIADEYCFIHSTYTRGVVEQGRWAYRPGNTYTGTLSSWYPCAMTVLTSIQSFLNKPVV